MNFKNVVRAARYLLLPFSLIYGMVVMLRNLLYDKRVLHSASFDLPVICIGNLSVGGTGKTPVAAYLLALLKDAYIPAILSRGYRRKTKGYRLADMESDADEIGDEPMQLHAAFPGTSVAVAESRLEGIPSLLADAPGTQVIILDDAFQHRSVNAGLNILLTEFGNLYTHDFFLPAGNLRDEKRSAARADIIIVTKCPPDLRYEEKEKIIQSIRPAKRQQVLFAAIRYMQPYHLFSGGNKPLSKDDAVLLVTGIANTGKLAAYLQDFSHQVKTLKFKDHHSFSEKDIRRVRQVFTHMSNPRKVIITTAKDAVKLVKFQELLKGLPVFVLPIELYFLFDGREIFDGAVRHFIDNFKRQQ